MSEYCPLVGVRPNVGDVFFDTDIPTACLGCFNRALEDGSIAKQEESLTPTKYFESEGIDTLEDIFERWNTSGIRVTGEELREGIFESGAEGIGTNIENIEHRTTFNFICNSLG